MDYSEVMKRLQAGETPESIAQEMIDAVNKAVQSIELQKAKEQQKYADAEEILSNITKFIENYYPNETILNELGTITADDLVKFCETSMNDVVECIKQIKLLEQNLKSLGITTGSKEPVNPEEVKKALESWLKGLK